MPECVCERGWVGVDVCGVGVGCLRGGGDVLGWGGMFREWGWDVCGVGG